MKALPYIITISILAAIFNPVPGIITRGEWVFYFLLISCLYLMYSIGKAASVRRDTDRRVVWKNRYVSKK